MLFLLFYRKLDGLLIVISMSLCFWQLVYCKGNFQNKTISLAPAVNRSAMSICGINDQVSWTLAVGIQFIKFIYL